jgi:hypothetical protein
VRFGVRKGSFSDDGFAGNYPLDTMPYSVDTPVLMFARFTTLLVLAAITLQGVFGSLQGSVLICLGGGHEHAVTEVVEHCDLQCSHHSEWPTPAASDEHLDDCDCTDFELGLVVLLSTPRVAEYDITLATAAVAIVSPLQVELGCRKVRGPPSRDWHDPGGEYRLAAIRTTRLLV